MKKSVNYRLQLARENSPMAPLDYNNNNTKSLRRTPSPPLQQLPGCICHRKSQIIECEKCKMLCYGRVSEPCPQHPNVTYLLDLFYCPSCTCSRIYLKAKTSST